MKLTESSQPQLKIGIDESRHELSPFPLQNQEDNTLISVGAVKAGGAIVRYTTEQLTITPESTPVLIGKGYGGSEAAYSRFRHELSRLDNDTTTYATPRTIGDQHPERMQSKTAWAVARELGRAADTFEVDFVTHSMSGWIGTNLALRKPYGIRHLIVMGGAGLTGHNALSLAPGAAKLTANVISDLPRIRDLSYTKSDIIESLRHIFVNPLRSLAEMATVAGCDVRDTLPKLSSLGVDVTLVQFEQDELFPTEKVEHYAEQSGLKMVVAPGLGHASPFTHPKEVAEVVNKVLKA